MQEDASQKASPKAHAAIPALKDRACAAEGPVKQRCYQHESRHTGGPLRCESRSNGCAKRVAKQSHLVSFNRVQDAETLGQEKLEAVIGCRPSRKPVSGQIEANDPPASTEQKRCQSVEFPVWNGGTVNQQKCAALLPLRPLIHDVGGAGGELQKSPSSHQHYCLEIVATAEPAASASEADNETLIVRHASRSSRSPGR